MRKAQNSYISFEKQRARNKLENLCFIDVETMNYKMLTHKWSKSSSWLPSNVIILLLLLVNCKFLLLFE